MIFEPWHLAAMEDNGYMDTNIGLINRVAIYLSDSPNDTIEEEEFRNACVACNVDPESFTEKDLQQLQEKLNRIT